MTVMFVSTARVGKVILCCVIVKLIFSDLGWKRLKTFLRGGRRFVKFNTEYTVLETSANVNRSV